MATVSTGTQTTTQDLHSSNSPSKSYPPTSGHSGRLKYANPQDLPSYPSLGLKKDDAAAGAAASLGWASARPVSLWTPEKDASAQRAATLANDYRIPAAWQPDRQPPGSKAAAVLAAGTASRAEKRASMPASVWGTSAANQAFAAPPGGGGGGVEPREPMGTLDRQKSLRAAREALAGSGRPRSKSSPVTYPDSANAAANALSAATIAHQPTIKIRLEDAGALPVAAMGREMYTAHPTFKADVDERNREAVLHASAVAMAKRMYSRQQMITNRAKQAQGQREAGSRPGSAGTGGAQQPIQFMNLQEAAYKLAQERLARLQDEHQRNRDVAEYYGTSPTTPLSPGRRLKLGRLRRRASSDGDVVASRTENDRQRSKQIRKQMSLFSTRLDEVDEAKRTRDREALLTAAQRNVKAAMEGMDEKMYRETGSVAPAKLHEWESKAYAAAQSRSDARMASDRIGRVDLGAGKYMNREEVEEIAARRVQPVLDEINEKAEIERKRIVALREEQEKKKLEWEAEKARNAEVKENQRKLKEGERLRKEDLRQEAKARKEEEKAARAEEERLSREKDKPRTHGGASFDGPALEASEKNPEDNTHHKHRLHRPFTPKLQTKTSPPKNDTSAVSPDTSPGSAAESPSTRVKNWLKSRLHKPRAKSISTIKHGKSEKAPGGFIGGHALTRLHADGTGSMTSLSEGTRSASIREVALAGRPTSTLILRRGDELGGSSRQAGGSVSSVSSDDNVVRGAREARLRKKSGPQGGLNPTVAPPRAVADLARMAPRSSASPNRDSKFIEIIE